MRHLTHGSALAQLERDQFDELEGDETERAYRRGWNAGARHAADICRAQDDEVARLRAELACVVHRIERDFVATGLVDLGGEA